LLLWSAKVTKTLIGKRLLYVQGHAAQRSEQHRSGPFAPLTFTQANPSAKSPMPLSNTQGHHCSARFWPKLFADIQPICHCEIRSNLVVSKSDPYSYEIATLTKFNIINKKLL
jgi:hypothetical protein